MPATAAWLSCSDAVLRGTAARLHRRAAAGRAAIAARSAMPRSPARPAGRARRLPGSARKRPGEPGSSCIAWMRPTIQASSRAARIAARFETSEQISTGRPRHVAVRARAGRRRRRRRCAPASSPPEQDRGGPSAACQSLGLALAFQMSRTVDIGHEQIGERDEEPGRRRGRASPSVRRRRAPGHWRWRDRASAGRGSASRATSPAGRAPASGELAAAAHPAPHQRNHDGAAQTRRVGQSASAPPARARRRRDRRQLPPSGRRRRPEPASARNCRSASTRCCR